MTSAEYNACQDYGSDADSQGLTVREGNYLETELAYDSSEEFAEIVFGVMQRLSAHPKGIGNAILTATPGK